jgi:hypothetical protein
MISRRELFKLAIFSPLIKLLNQPKVNPYIPEWYKDRLEKFFDRDDIFYARIAKSPVTLISTREFRIPLQIKPGSDFEVKK